MNDRDLYLVWAALIALTGVSLWLGGEHGLSADTQLAVGVAALVAAFVKVRFVVLDFMEGRHFPVRVRVAAEVWTAIIGATLVGLYLLV
ncbi:cytochrome C oxidase subunit IV family protein [Mycolicibacterium septicum]|uniref:cytochrome C oxidase subunit IV family protein n=1 Tax=Mycolicibacterium septicum TaxID=98668 RepID=UPI002362511A|nr:cytochrome C oxidase subunit IV family protein [Mycolicibacterium septicum]